jgi:hypothetical protein
MNLEREKNKVPFPSNWLSTPRKKNIYTSKSNTSLACSLPKEPVVQALQTPVPT